MNNIGTFIIRNFITSWGWNLQTRGPWGYHLTVVLHPQHQVQRTCLADPCYQRRPRTFLQAYYWLLASSPHLPVCCSCCHQLQTMEKQVVSDKLVGQRILLHHSISTTLKFSLSVSECVGEKWQRDICS